MRQILAVSVLLLCGSWMAAQSNSSSQQGYGQTSSNAGAQTSVEGCLSSSAGKYMLTDKQGMTYELTGDTSKLSDHVGHTVKITGTESAGSATASGGMGNSAGSEKTLEVSSVKHISKTCKNGNMSGGSMSH